MRGPFIHDGTLMKTSTSFCSRSSWRSRLRLSTSMSMPLFLYSYLPPVQMMVVSSLFICVPSSALATWSILARAVWRAVSNGFPSFGTKLSSNPLVSTASTGVSRSCRHSRAVMSLTVVKQSMYSAVCFSSECLDSILSSRAICSPLYAQR